MKKVSTLVSASLIVLLACAAAAIAGDGPSISMNWYGYFKLDGSYDQNPTSHGNFIMYIPQNPTYGDKSQFTMTANETRLGLNAAGNGYGDVTIGGKLEVDLYASITGATIAENKAMMQLRHAYFFLEKRSFKVVAGQTWDLISPLNPSTLNYSVLWGCGNTGYRRAQVSFWYTSKPNKTTDVVMATGLFRTIGNDLTPTFTLATGEANDGVDDGINSAIPSLQALFEVKHSTASGGAYRGGISALYGALKAETNQGRSEDYSSWAVVGHWSVSPSTRFGFSGELFTGSNLGSYFGSILRNSEIDGLKTTGGWISSWVQASKKVQLSAGYGIDDPKDDLITSGRTQNTSFYGNIRYAVVPKATVGLELAQWRTDYKNADNATDFRAQTSFILGF
jgi:hypothetical protein